MRLTTFRLLATAGLLTTTPLAVQADSIWHRGYGEETVTYHPDHAAPTRTRAEVKAELRAAQQSGTLQRSFVGIPDHPPATPRTRESVVREMMQESPESRASRLREGYSSN